MVGHATARVVVAGILIAGCTLGAPSPADLNKEASSIMTAQEFVTRRLVQLDGVLSPLECRLLMDRGAAVGYSKQEYGSRFAREARQRATEDDPLLCQLCGSGSSIACLYWQDSTRPSRQTLRSSIRLKRTSRLALTRGCGTTAITLVGDFPCTSISPIGPVRRSGASSR